MYLQEFKIYLIGGHVLKAAEEVTIPAEHRLLNRSRKPNLMISFLSAVRKPVRLTFLSGTFYTSPPAM